MEKIVEIIRKLIKSKFTGEIIINFNQGGIRGIKKAVFENIE
jgi:hypothetical protein